MSAFIAIRNEIADAFEVLEGVRHAAARAARAKLAGIHNEIAKAEDNLAVVELAFLKKVQAAVRDNAAGKEVSTEIDAILKFAAEQAAAKAKSRRDSEPKTEPAPAPLKVPEPFVQPANPADLPPAPAATT